MRSVRLACTAVLLAAVAAAPSRAGESVAHLYWVSVEDGQLWRSRADGSEVRELAPGAATAITVELDLANATLFYSVWKSGGSNNGVWRADLDGGNRHQLASSVERVYDIELDAGAGKIYWTDQVGVVRRADLDGANAETVVTGASQPSGLGLDLDAGRLYYTSGGSVRSATLAGGDDQLVTSVSSPKDVEVDSANGKLYFSSALTSTALRWCDLDGTDCATLVTGAVGEIEIEGDTVYFFKGSTLWQMDLDGGNQQQVPGPVPATSEFGLDLTNSHLYLVENNIFRTDLDGTDPVSLVAFLGSGGHDVAIDALNGRLYFGETQTRALTESPLEPFEPRAVMLDPPLGFTDFRGIELDAAAGEIYWADLSAGEIWKASLAAGTASAIVSGLDTPHDVALDLVNGKVYWTQSIDSPPSSGRPARAEGPTSAVIRRANLDGSIPEDVVPGLSAGLRGLDVDAAGGKIYWTDMFGGTISRADLTGANVETIVPGLDKPHDVAVDPSTGFLYWTAGIGNSGALNGSIGRAELDGSNPVTLVTDLPDRIRDLTLAYHADFVALFDDGFESGNTSAWTTTVP